MTDDGYVFPVEMSTQEMEWYKRSMMLTGSVFTKFEPLYELGDGTSMFTFLVKPTELSPAAGGMGSVASQGKMEFDDYHMTQSHPPGFPFPGGESPGGCRAVSPGKKNAPTLPGLQSLPSPHQPSPASRPGCKE